MNIQVMSLKAFNEYKSKRHDHCCIVISITSLNQEDVIVTADEHSNAKIVRVLHIKANDVDYEELGGLNSSDAMRIVRFVSNYYSQFIDIIVHCGAGQSRSAGVAAAIMKYYKDDDKPIFNNPKYTPNMLFYRRVLEAFMVMSESSNEH